MKKKTIYQVAMAKMRNKMCMLCKANVVGLNSILFYNLLMCVNSENCKGKWMWERKIEKCVPKNDKSLDNNKIMGHSLCLCVYVNRMRIIENWDAILLKLINTFMCQKATLTDTHTHDHFLCVIWNREMNICCFFINFCKRMEWTVRISDSDLT